MERHFSILEVLSSKILQFEFENKLLPEFHCPKYFQSHEHLLGLSYHFQVEACHEVSWNVLRRLTIDARRHELEGEQPGS